jgi:hypothetical protein
MARVIRRRWASDLSGPSRRDSGGCEYEAYVPDFLVGRKITVDGDVAADVTDAEAAIARLNVEATSLVDTEALARILLRAESVASSKIEGLEIGPRRLLRAEAARHLGEEPADVTAAEVLANIDAMVHAIDEMRVGEPITVDLLLQIHKRLLAGTRIAEHGGHFREVQNWIGGSDYNPCTASFIPPPHEQVEELMADLVAFSNEDSLPAVAQAAIAHAQFETPVHRRQRSNWAHVDPPHPSPTWCCDPNQSSGLADSRNVGQGLRRWTYSNEIPRTGNVCRCTQGSQPLGREIRRSMQSRRR